MFQYSSRSTGLGFSPAGVSHTSRHTLARYLRDASSLWAATIACFTRAVLAVLHSSWLRRIHARVGVLPASQIFFA